MVYFLGETKLPSTLLPPPDTRTWQKRGADARGQFGELVAATEERRRLVESFYAEDHALLEAYDKRIEDVFSLTGKKLVNPYRAPVYEQSGPFTPVPEDMTRKGRVSKFETELRDLVQQHPDKIAAFRLDVPVRDDAIQLAVRADERARKAGEAAKDLPVVTRFSAQVLGFGRAAMSDEVDGPSMFAGGAGLGRAVAARILTAVATEAAVNGGIEAGVQLAARDWQLKAGVEPAPFWESVGLAAAFGGGLGGLAQGVGEVLARSGRVTPDTTEILQRVAKGEVAEADIPRLADAMGVKLADGDAADLARAADVDVDAAAVLVPDLDPKLADDMARAMADGTRPPGLRDEVEDFAQQKQGQIPDNEISGIEPGNMPQIISQDVAAPVHLRDDPAFTAYVAEQNAQRLAKLEDWVAMNEADIAHLRDDGDLAALTSERDFSGVRASDDVDRAQRVVHDLEMKVTKAKAEIASAKAYNTDDVALQKRFADERGQRVIVPAEVKAQKLGEVNSVAAQELATARLVAAGGEKVAAKPKPDDMVKRQTLDIMDAMPAGTDVNGKPIVTTHAEMTDYAARLNDLADVIASCKAT
jgi:hypothetical protein